MQGITLQATPNGQTIITIDPATLDPKFSPLVTGLLTILQNDVEQEEYQAFLSASGMLANRAYGEDQHEYTDEDLIERNPNYRPK